MPGFPTLDAHLAIRTLVPGIFLGICFYAMTRMSMIPKFDELIVSTPGYVGLFFLGFLFDVLGFYKIHPVYRRIRRDFFLGLNELGRLATSSDVEKIHNGEHVRETVLDALETTKFNNLRIEHAIWISLYNVSELSLAVILCLFVYHISAGDFAVFLFRRDFQWFSGIMLVFSICALIAAAARNNSYNRKITNAAAERRRTKRRTK